MSKADVIKDKIKSTPETEVGAIEEINIYAGGTERPPDPMICGALQVSTLNGSFATRTVLASPVINVTGKSIHSSSPSNNPSETPIAKL
jgi:hypothetical protein